MFDLITGTNLGKKNVGDFLLGKYCLRGIERLEVDMVFVDFAKDANMFFSLVQIQNISECGSQAHNNQGDGKKEMSHFGVPPLLALGSRFKSPAPFLESEPEALLVEGSFFVVEFRWGVSFPS